MHALIVRLSSMGDVLQTLPAITDAQKAIPGIRFDWVADESFAEIPAWHQGVDKVIHSGFRRWRRNWRSALNSREPQKFLERLRARNYDAIIDLQGEIKSALASRLAKGPRYGYDRAGVHEWGAQFAYRQKFAVAKGQHSIQRMRKLLSHALNYEFNASEVDYGIDRSRLPEPAAKLPQPYLIFIHSTSWTSKNLPEEYWRQLTHRAVKEGFSVVLPWGSEAERARAARIAGTDPRATVLPDLSISQKASIIARARATVGLDTGLSHIAAALDVPSVTVYGATDPLLVGATGKHQAHLASAFQCVKCHEHECFYPGESAFRPACLVETTPGRIWLELEQLWAGRSAEINEREPAAIVSQQ